MRKLLLVWAVWRLTRVAGAIALIAVLGMLVLGHGRTTGQSGRDGRSPIERAIQPIARELERTLENGLKP